ncbi:MAG: metal ABC transporter substrate-binding protein [Oscillospiraceae bacterium]|nr:metal ABC transporter substrate-binding protein [Oscillospiraceae bacterium]
MKKIFALMMCAVMTAAAAAGCGEKKDDDKKENRLSVVCSIFPEYDWVRQIAGDKADDMDLTLLLDNGLDLHNYQPTTEDIVKISECDVFIYVGGESDTWADKALSTAKNKDMQVINIMDVLSDRVKEEEVIEGMQAEEEEAEEEEGPEYDEHVWLSLSNASFVCDAVADSLAAADSENAETYRTNLEDYKKQLDGLDSEYREMAAGAERKTVVFGDRFPFRYMMDDYSIDYYAAFVGCSAETEASFETIVFLADKVDEFSLPGIFKIDSSDGTIAKTIIENTKESDQKIFTLNSMQSVNTSDIEKGTTYLSIMKDNLESLREALK